MAAAPASEITPWEVLFFALSLLTARPRHVESLSFPDGEAGLLLIGVCRKADVVACFSRRGEDEIVINPANVKIIECVEIGEDNVATLVGAGEVGDD